MRDCAANIQLPSASVRGRKRQNSSRARRARVLRPRLLSTVFRITLKQYQSISPDELSGDLPPSHLSAARIEISSRTLERNGSRSWKGTLYAEQLTRAGIEHLAAGAEAGADLFRVEVDAADLAACRRTLEALAA